MSDNKQQPLAYGVTEAMIETYGDVIFKLSLNHQRRLGDPARALDVEEVTRQREDMGLTDEAIAAKTGLSLRQVITIRNIVERRKFRRNQYRKLYDLGGGKRYRKERYSHPAERDRYSPAAERLRRACRYDPRQAQRYIREGWWQGQTLHEYLARHVQLQPDAAALIGTGGDIVSWSRLAGFAAALAKRLQEAGLERGAVVGIALPPGEDAVIAYMGAAAYGFTAQLLPWDIPQYRLAALTEQAGTAALIKSRNGTAVLERGTASQTEEPFEPMTADSDDSGVESVSQPVGADPAAILYRDITARAPLAAIHPHQALLSQVPGIADFLNIDPGTKLFCALPLDHWAGLLAWHMALAAGATFSFQPGGTDKAVVAAAQPWPKKLKSFVIAAGSSPSSLCASGAGAVLLGQPELPVIARSLKPESGNFILPAGTQVRLDHLSCIEIDSPSAFAGYLDHSAATAFARSEDGWLMTGINAELTDETGLRFTDTP